jgi:hypothetical protein
LAQVPVNALIGPMAMFQCSSKFTTLRLRRRAPVGYWRELGKERADF